MSGYLNEGVLLYLKDLIDWESLLRMRKGDDVDVEAKRAAYLEVLETSRRVLGPEHPHTLNYQTNLAYVYSRLGRETEAERLYREAVEILRRVLGEGHPRTVGVLHDLAGHAARRGDRGAALEWLRQAVEKGNRSAAQIARDPNLESLHGDPEFEAIVAEVKRRIEEE